MFHSFLMVIHVLCAIGIIGLVLIQRGKGADAGAGFGAGASGTVFGARGASTALSRTTAVLAATFMVTSLSLAYMGQRVAVPDSTILDEASNSELSVPVPVAPAAPASAPATTAAPAMETAPPSK
ncbi:MAG: preprotein translocase subunit SecG [Steroidobacteraceae bacterium]